MKDMRKLTGRTKIYSRSPLTMIETVLAGLAIVGGFYVLSPIFIVPLDVTQGAVIAQALSSALVVGFIGIVSVLLGTYNLLAIRARSYKHRARALFWMILVRFYITFATILINGFLPMTWLAGLGIALVAIVLYFYNRDMAVLTR